jgi:hypothetical protein
MRPFASQGQSSSVNGFGFDDVAELYDVLPCTCNKTVRIKLGFKLCMFNADLLCPRAVLLVLLSHKDTVIMI